MTTFALIGSGFRAQTILRVAQELGTVRCAAAVVRTPRRLDVPTYPSLDACLREVSVDFVLTATPKPVTPPYDRRGGGPGLPVLAETPPAPDLDGLRRLWSAVGDSGLVSGRRAVPADAVARRPRGPGGDRRDRPADPGAGLLHPAVPRGGPDPRSARRRPRTGHRPGQPVHRSRWSARWAGPAGPTTTRRTRPPRRSPPSTSATGARGSTTSPSSRPATSCGSAG